jgi:2-polyprenyl-3-methyl-5-hydroxy-6-metoxy-1,4-benzoquinol methylase
MKSFNGWQNVDKFTLHEVVNLVLTNGVPETIPFDSWLLEHMGDENLNKNVLDFGCGVGRNIIPLSIERKNWNFIGYDNINMLKKLEEYSLFRFHKNIDEYTNIKFFSDWEYLKTKKFDIVYCTLVLQHIYEPQLSVYINDFKKMTNFLIVYGRRFNDEHQKSTWKILEENGLIPYKFYQGNEEIEYNSEGNLHDHSLAIYQL